MTWGGLGATYNCLWFVGPWIGLVSHLGCLRNDEGHDADWGGVGISFHGRMVASGWGGK
jgi:hypothetical protein